MRVFQYRFRVVTIVVGVHLNVAVTFAHNQVLKKVSFQSIFRILEIVQVYYC